VALLAVICREVKNLPASVIGPPQCPNHPVMSPMFEVQVRPLSQSADVHRVAEIIMRDAATDCLTERDAREVAQKILGLDLVAAEEVSGEPGEEPEQ
jgi:hypothetical protein